MLDKFVEFEMYIFPGKAFSKFMSENFGDEDADEITKIINKSNGQSTDLPEPITSRIKFNPDDILSYNETYSIIEFVENPDTPNLDSLEVTVRMGEVNTEILLNCSMEEFESKINEHYKQRTEVPVKRKKII